MLELQDVTKKAMKERHLHHDRRVTNCIWLKYTLPTHSQTTGAEHSHAPCLSNACNPVLGKEPSDATMCQKRFDNIHPSKRLSFFHWASHAAWYHQARIGHTDPFNSTELGVGCLLALPHLSVPQDSSQASVPQGSSQATMERYNCMNRCTYISLVSTTISI